MRIDGSKRHYAEEPRSQQGQSPIAPMLHKATTLFSHSLSIDSTW
jgi:hypothetical protein